MARCYFGIDIRSVQVSLEQAGKGTIARIASVDSALAHRVSCVHKVSSIQKPLNCTYVSLMSINEIEHVIRRQG